VENFFEYITKNFVWKFHTVTEKSFKNEMISIGYDVNNHVYSKSKPINFVRISPISKLNGFWQYVRRIYTDIGLDFE